MTSAIRFLKQKLYHIEIQTNLQILDLINCNISEDQDQSHHCFTVLQCRPTFRQWLRFNNHVETTGE